MERTVKAEIERKYPHLKVIKVGRSKYGTPIAIVQVVAKESPVYGIYAVMYKYGGEWRSGVRSADYGIVERAFKRYETYGIY